MTNLAPSWMSAVALLWISLALASAIPITLLVGYLNRRGKNDDRTKGIGWQFIRYTVLAIALPIVALLALNDALTEGAATIIASAIGYAFGRPGRDD